MTRKGLGPWLRGEMGPYDGIVAADNAVMGFQHGCDWPGREGQDEDARIRPGAETAP
jgi:hypothetical protein